MLEKRSHLPAVMPFFNVEKKKSQKYLFNRENAQKLQNTQYLTLYADTQKYASKKYSFKKSVKITILGIHNYDYVRVCSCI